MRCLTNVILVAATLYENWSFLLKTQFSVHKFSWLRLQVMRYVHKLSNCKTSCMLNAKETNVTIFFFHSFYRGCYLYAGVSFPYSPPLLCSAFFLSSEVNLGSFFFALWFTSVVDLLVTSFLSASSSFSFLVSPLLGSSF